MRNRKNQLLREVYYYPDYMSFSAQEMGDLLKSFTNIFKSIWSSVKLFTATLMLNINVVQAAWSGKREQIQQEMLKFQEKRQAYDKEMDENLEYFKKYYSESRLDTLGGFGPRVLAFAANPLAFASAEISSATAGRGSGALKPYDVSSPISSMLGIAGPQSKNDDADGFTPNRSKKREATKAISTRLQRALDFFKYDASSGINEAATQQTNSQPQVELKKLNSIAKNYVAAERKHADEILERVASMSAAMQKMLKASTFDELSQAMQDVTKMGLRLDVQGVKTAGKNIRAEFEKQSKEEPEKFKEAVKSMLEKAPDSKGSNDVETALKFVFGVSKTNMQQQMISLQEELLKSSRAAMKLPLDDDTRKKLQQSEIGNEYLRLLDSFERQLMTGQRDAEAAKKSLKTSGTGV